MVSETGTGARRDGHENEAGYSRRERERTGSGNGAGTGTGSGSGSGRDSVRRTCLTARRTAWNARVEQRRMALDELRRKGGIRVNGRNGGNGGEVDIPNRIQEVA